MIRPPFRRQAAVLAVSSKAMCQAMTGNIKEDLRVMHSVTRAGWTLAIQRLPAIGQTIRFCEPMPNINKILQ
jgi:hypothetical protein